MNEFLNGSDLLGFMSMCIACFSAAMGAGWFLAEWWKSR